jgi:hypothetical protein
LCEKKKNVYIKLAEAVSMRCGRESVRDKGGRECATAPPRTPLFYTATDHHHTTITTATTPPPPPPPTSNLHHLLHHRFIESTVSHHTESTQVAITRFHMYVPPLPSNPGSSAMNTQGEPPSIAPALKTKAAGKRREIDMD